MKTSTLCMFLLSACGNDVGAPDPGGPDANADPFPPPAMGVQITSGPLTVDAGEQKTLCVRLDLPSATDLPVVELEQHNAGTVHHFILFRAASAADPSVGPCPSGLFIQHPPIYPGTRDQGAFAMPDGVAITLPAHQPLILQLHLLNAGDQPVVEEMRINLHSGPAGTYQKAGVVGGSNFLFQIPPHQKYTATQRCYITNALKLFALASHSHARTLSFDVTANLASGPTAIYHNEMWSAPAFGHYDPAYDMGAFDWLEFSCTWFNETGSTIKYGETADDEMCMMFGYYYPATLDVTPCLGL